LPLLEVGVRISRVILLDTRKSNGLMLCYEPLTLFGQFDAVSGYLDARVENIFPSGAEVHWGSCCAITLAKMLAIAFEYSTHAVYPETRT